MTLPLENGELITDEKEVGEVLNSYFANITNHTTGRDPCQNFDHTLLSNEDEIINEILNKYEDHPSIQLIKSQSQVNLGEFTFRRAEKDDNGKILLINHQNRKP